MEHIQEVTHAEQWVSSTLTLNYLENDGRDIPYLVI